MDSTLQFLWNRRAGGRPPSEQRNWVISLLEGGVESDAILRLARDSQLDWLIEQVW
jgi:hypothetical protein